jgi:hypothetical protein
VGQAPNVAAKLCGIRDAPYYSFITGAIYDGMATEVKITNNQNMWEERNWTSGPIKRVFRSSWTWKP